MEGLKQISLASVVVAQLHITHDFVITILRFNLLIVKYSANPIR